MKRFWKILRVIMVVLLLIVAGLPIAVYIVVSTPWAQNELRSVANNQLSDLLGTQVEIGRVDYRPFNVLTVNSVNVKDDYGRVALSIGTISSRFELLKFLNDGELVFDYAVVDAVDLRIYRESKKHPLNIQGIIDRLSPKEKNKKPTAFDLEIDVVMLRNGHIRYDVIDAPDIDDRFDANHVEINDLSLYAYIRHASQNEYDILLEDFKFSEKSGFNVKHIGADVKVDQSQFTLEGFNIDLENSTLSLAPINVETEHIGDIAGALKERQINLRPIEPVKLSTSDFLCFAPQLETYEQLLTVDFNVDVSLQQVDVNMLDIRNERGVNIYADGSVGSWTDFDNIEVELSKIDVVSPAGYIGSFIKNKKIGDVLGKLGNIEIDGRGRANSKGAQIKMLVSADDATISVEGLFNTNDRYRSISFDGISEIENVDLNKIAGNKLGRFSAVVESSGNIKGKSFNVNCEASISSLEWNNYQYSDIVVNGKYDSSTSNLSVDMLSQDDAANFAFNATGSLGKVYKELAVDCKINTVDLNALNIENKHPGYVLSADVDVDLSGATIDDIDGFVNISDLSYCNVTGDGLKIKNIDIKSDRTISPELITIKSDFLDGSIEGNFVPSTLFATLRDMAAHIVPNLLQHDEELHQRLSEQPEINNEFIVDLMLHDAEDISHFFNLPVHVIYPVEISCLMNSHNGNAHFSLDAPYLQQGDKIIESTVFNAYVDTESDWANVYATTKMPTKKGPMTVVLGVSGANNRFDTEVDWLIDRKVPLNGEINFSTGLSRSVSQNVCVSTDINPGQINFGDDIWLISPSNIDWCDSILSVTDFALTADDQHIDINGYASHSFDDVLNINLKNIHLESIFETLEIDKALIGGNATGLFTARQIFSKTPILTTNNLHVDQIGYNYCTIGDADITANWSNEKQSFELNADIVNPEGLQSSIKGDIYPTKESLDLHFNANHIKVGFMKPFMEAFTSDVSGYVSGDAHLFGTFKNVDMTGDIYAEDLKIKIDFTNTYYTATDSIHVKPGLIELDGIEISDMYGNKAMLNGFLKHDYFHLPVFKFEVSDARNFLSYDVPEALSPVWYGKIFGNGSASVVGEPGKIKIGVKMTTAANSVFTFVLTDQLEAEQYSFITFNDRTEITEEERRRLEDNIPEIVREYQRRMAAKIEDSPSTYIMDIEVDITPEANLNIIMDPVGGDCIRSWGAGDMHMTYNSTGNDLYIAGKYTVESGSYNFTLQDIIIKNFTINPTSTISFEGDPYAAKLDIEAVYSVNANLSDLDESFTQDKDLNRTNVPVQALLKVSGDMRQPEIAFDLNFPTLKSDTYRKVRSIISTDDMMNRQIIYLLALNRFYTPDYMASTTSGNELFSVASSTISSQLSSILGKLSDKWSIAPNLRSDRGDFSDVEVDVALSSRLLNNRLLFNGNFGYRDKSLNTNQFIGDFDIQYLLNRSGTWRLRAYSRFNDQNYYLRTAATTQGVGIMFRRDFDNIFPVRGVSSIVDTTSIDNDSVVPTIIEIDQSK